MTPAVTGLALALLLAAAGCSGNGISPVAPAPAGGDDGAYSLDFSRDGRSLAFAGWKGKVAIRNLASGDEKTLFQSEDNDNKKSHALILALSPDGKALVTGHWDNSFRLWDLASGEASPLTGHRAVVKALAFSPDGTALASGTTVLTGSGSQLKVWDVESRKERVGRIISSGLGALAFAPAAKTLAVGGNGKVHLLTLDKLEELATLPVEGGEMPRCLAFSADGDLLAGGGGAGVITLWDVNSKRVVTTLKGHDGTIHALAFSADGTTLASGGGDKTARLWDVKARNERHTLSGHQRPVVALSFSSDGATLTTASNDKTIKRWDSQTGKEQPKP